MYYLLLLSLFFTRFIVFCTESTRTFKFFINSYRVKGIYVIFNACFQSLNDIYFNYYDY